MPHEDDRLSIPQIAALAKVSTETVHNWIDKDEMTAEIEYRGKQRRRWVRKEEWSRFAATLPVAGQETV